MSNEVLHEVDLQYVLDEIDLLKARLEAQGREGSIHDTSNANRCR